VSERPYCAAGGNACDSFQIGLRERPCPEGECSVRPLVAGQDVEAQARALAEQIAELAKVLMEEFGGPTRSEGAVDMAIRLLREQRAAQAEAEKMPVTYRRIDGKGLIYAVYGSSSNDYANALEAKVAEAERKGANEMLDRIRGALKTWPDGGCDRVVATYVEAIAAGRVAEAERRAQEAEERRAETVAANTAAQERIKELEMEIESRDNEFKEHVCECE
jgi:hypothetical protein